MEPLLRVEDLRTHFFTSGGIVKAVDGVSFVVHKGETLGIVGESGCGKSVTALSVLRLIPDPGKIVGGHIWFKDRDVARMSSEELREFRGNDVAMIFQDPMTSLNPVLRIGFQIKEAMVAHERFDNAAAEKRVVPMLEKVRIPAPKERARNYPHQFSGGMRQRAMIAMGLSNEPGLLIADEPTTALDVTVQAQIIELLRDLNREMGTAVV
ncbi:MAG: ABC transporter ATP-binding protein, partial [Chloroflexota bacterium]